MIRILLFLFLVFVLGLGFTWLADRPGDLVVTFGGYQYEISLMVAAVAVAVIIAAVMIAWWLAKAIWTSPYTIRRYFRARRRDRGYQALSTGMIAAGAGDAAKARQMNKQAAKLIRSDQEPLINLLDAQASLLEGDHETARQKFEAMLDDPEMRLLGLRGLYLEAERLGDRAAARHYAGRAAEVAPQLAWASEATLEEKTERGDWDGALKLLDGQKSSRQVDRDVANRRRTVLLTAKAISLLDIDPATARTAAFEANRLEPHFVPAALVAARALFRQDELRKGTRVLETAWKAAPHPEVADLYIRARPADAAQDRLARAKRLQSLKQNNPESALAVARAALDAGEYGLAREEAESAIRMQPREGAYLLLADIEEAETGDQGRVRQWLSKAVRAPRDPAWVADGYVSDRWAPISPMTGRLDAFEWKVPMERAGEMIEHEAGQGSGAPVLVARAKDIDESTAPAPAATASTKADAPIASSEGSGTKNEIGNGADEAAARAAALPDAVEEPSVQPGPPDDPGVDQPERETGSSGRFRLF